MLSALAAAGRDYRLADLFERAGASGEVTIGRSNDNVLALHGAPEVGGAPLPLMVSRRHARLQVESGQLLVRDEGTINGTYVNSHKLEGAAWKVLGEGDVVSFGG